MNSQNPLPHYRLVDHQKHRQIRRVGFHLNVSRDLYHFLMKCPFYAIVLSVLAFYIGINALFAWLYLLGGPVIENARPGSFADAFFFSVQTLATLGYGKMAPLGDYANIIVAIEVLVGLLGLALTTGLMYSKFSQPSAKILFSKIALITRRNGIPCFMFRMANARKNQIVEANLSLSLVHDERTLEGEFFRSFVDMKLTRYHSPIFGLTWLAIHPIDEGSPLFGKDLLSLQKEKAEIVISFSGIDDTFMQTVHQQHSFLPEEIVWDAQFEDILLTDEQGERYVDYRNFHLIRKTKN